MYQEIINFIRELYSSKESIPLHAPLFCGNEKKYLNHCIDTSFVSSVGEFVDRFEKMMALATQTKYAVATVNGTSALQIALKVVGVERDNEVITQPLSFVATANAIAHCGAFPIFLDVEKSSLGLCPEKLFTFLSEFSQKHNGQLVNRKTGRIIKAVVPVHIFGHIGNLDKIKNICEDFGLALIEDAAEALGSFKNGCHAGSFGQMGVVSFNGNKIVTSGGGGAIVTNSLEFATKAKHLTTTAKIPHRFEYVHDEIGYNYRMPNINAAVACAQLENLQAFLKDKKEIAKNYQEFFSDFKEVDFISEPEGCLSNYWLNAILFPDLKARNEFLDVSNNQMVMTRPVWQLLNRLNMYHSSYTSDLSVAIDFESRLVNIPSSVRCHKVASF